MTRDKKDWVKAGAGAGAGAGAEDGQWVSQ